MSEVEEGMVRVQVTGIAMAGTPQGPIPVALLEDDQKRVLLLVMDGVQALTIQTMLNGESPQSTHSFILELLSNLNATVKRAVIYGVSESRFLSKIALETSEGLKEIDGRASDIVTLAFVAKAPIMVSSEVMDKVAISKSELYRPPEESESAREDQEAS